MIKAIAYAFLLLALQSTAQQTSMYTQYTFNKAGMNPAASGSDISQIHYMAFGINRQWLGFDNAPTQNFFNFSYTIRPPRSYKHWQNVGIYIDTDQSGLIGVNSAYGGYTYHLLLRKTTTLSFGVYAGIRQFSKSNGTFDPSDPAVAKNKSSLFLYPDIIPGFRISNKKYFFDVSMRQITITNLKDFKGRKIGGPSILQPTAFFDYGRKIPMGAFVMMMPSVALNLPLIGPPIIDASTMFYFVNRVGAGLSIRNLSSVSGILQVRFFQNATAGFAYAFPINAMRYANQNGFEFVIGLTPIGMEAKLSGKHSVAKCPGLSY